MNKLTTLTAMLGIATLLARPVHAMPEQDVPASTVSSVPPIYPKEDQQTGSMWGTREIMRCPDGTKLVFGDQSPVCVPVATQSGSGQ